MSKADQKEPVSFAEEAYYRKFAGGGFLLNFFKDEAFTEIIDTMLFKPGKYKFSGENTLRLIDESGKVGDNLSFKLEEEKDGRQQMSFINAEKGIKFLFIKEFEPLKSFKDDPFYPANNTWRIKPKQTEDTAQLKARLSNYIKHIALILKAGTEREQSALSFKHSLGPLKIYNGGIGIYPYEIIPDSWKNCFYDEADAEKAYRIYEHYLETSSSYGGAMTGNWYVDDYNILLSIYGDFENVPQKK